MSVLKPCPWCKATSIDYEYVDHIAAKVPYRWFCKSCGASGPDGDDEDCTLWNTRAPDPAVAVLQAEADRLRFLLGEILPYVEPPPEPNCHCHISPPCGDCVDWSHLRETLDAIRSLAPPKEVGQ